MAAPESPERDDAVAKALRGFGPLGILAILVILAGNLVFAPPSALLVLTWVRRSRTPWSEIGFAQPRSWIASLVVGFVFGVAFKLLMKSVVMPLLGADPINQAYHYLVGNRAALPWAIYTMIVVAGFGEETLWRGYMFERLGKLFGSGVTAKAAIVVLTSVLFGLAHAPEQGVPGVQQATIVGLVYGTIFAITGRLDADGRACFVRPDGAGDHLLRSRDEGCAVFLQVAHGRRAEADCRRCLPQEML